MSSTELKQFISGAGVSDRPMFKHGVPTVRRSQRDHDDCRRQDRGPELRDRGKEDGLAAQLTRQVIFEDHARVPVANRLGDEGIGPLSHRHKRARWRTVDIGTPVSPPRRPDTLARSPRLTCASAHAFGRAIAQFQA